jgi:hypothetical protein
MPQLAMGMRNDSISIGCIEIRRCRSALERGRSAEGAGLHISGARGALVGVGEVYGQPWEQ